MQHTADHTSRSSNPPDPPQDRYKRLFNPPALSKEAKRQRAAAPDRPARGREPEPPTVLPWEDPNQHPAVAYWRGWQFAKSLVNTPPHAVNGLVDSLGYQGKRYMEALSDLLRHAVRRGGRR